MINKAAMFVLVGCDCHLFWEQPCLFGVWKTHRGHLGLVSHLGVSWNQEVSVTRHNMVAEHS